MINFRAMTYAVRTHPSPPSSVVLPFQPDDIAAERVLAHGDEGGLNALAIFLREFLELFLRGLC
jgi:hypothetical protein